MISVITPTGGRPEGLRLLEQYLARQTMQDFEWIVVDDADPTHVPSLPQATWLRPWRWDGKTNTQARNLAFGLMGATHDRVAIMEDDDWYHPQYLEVVDRWLDDADLVGEAGSRYYNVRTRSYRLNGNDRHASLCSTAVKGAARERLLEIVKRSPKYIDIDLWRTPGLKGRLSPFRHLSIGIKGLPGRAGIGIGHRELAQKDPTGAVLREWIGEDAEAFYTGAVTA